ncbi:MAG: isoprenylcysteine carboxylmethyltransferase family protein [Bdellovibrio sp.]|nr:isoprenylcysteine carboxylmethyltransferase family protein [Bdellovibrio sp.]
MQEVPKILHILLPPVWLAISFIGQLILNWKLPGPMILNTPWNYFGILPFSAGIGLIFWALLLFKRAGTDAVPFRNVTAFVAEGPYRFTRNPMYLAMMFVLLSITMFLGAATPFLMIPFFMLIITVLFIRREETLLETKFGEEYLAYKRCVRRWI